MHVRSPPFHPPTSTHLSSPSYQPSFSQSDTSFFLEFRAYCWNELASDGDGGIVGGCSGLGQFLNSGSRMFLWICAREMERLSYLSLRISHLCSLSPTLSVLYAFSHWLLLFSIFSSSFSRRCIVRHTPSRLAFGLACRRFFRSLEHFKDPCQAIAASKHSVYKTLFAATRRLRVEVGSAR